MHEPRLSRSERASVELARLESAASISRDETSAPEAVLGMPAADLRRALAERFAAALEGS